MRPPAVGKSIDSGRLICSGLSPRSRGGRTTSIRISPSGGKGAGVGDTAAGVADARGTAGSFTGGWGPSFPRLATGRTSTIAGSLVNDAATAANPAGVGTSDDQAV